ncbi:MAG: PQQ-dependent sugar dehydrogenase [Planctomycetota bacterium]
MLNSIRQSLVSGRSAAMVVGVVAAAGLASCSQPEGPVTPTGETALETGWTMTEISIGLMKPWGAAWLPDGETILVTEKEGRLRVIENGQLRGTVVKGVPEDVYASGQGGLMDIQLHPEFEDNRLVYMTLSTGTRQANRTELIRGRLNADLSALEDVERLFKVSSDKQGGQHFGSRILWLDDGTLLMSIGDGGNPPTELDGEFIRNKALDTTSHLGKVLRMDADGNPVDGAPFAGEGADPLVYSFGHRNIQGMAIRPGTDEVWASEHGARGGDELNVITAGANYGWPEVTYSIEYWGPKISDETEREGTVQPEVVWTPCIAPSGLTFYTGDAFPEWQGDLFAGGLVLRQIRRVDLEDGDIVGETTLQFEDRIRWVGMGPDGGLYVLTDEIDGGLYRIDPDQG